MSHGAAVWRLWRKHSQIDIVFIENNHQFVVI